MLILCFKSVKIGTTQVLRKLESIYSKCSKFLSSEDAKLLSHLAEFMFANKPFDFAEQIIP